MKLFLLLIVINFLNLTKCEDEIEVVALPVWNSNGQLAEVPLNFSVFGETFNLRLKRNNNLLAPGFQLWTHEGGTSEKVQPKEPAGTHYLHTDSHSSAAISFCRTRALKGMIIVGNSSYEISPLKHGKHLRHRISNRSIQDSEVLHVVKKSTFKKDEFSKKIVRSLKTARKVEEKDQERLNKVPRMTIELALAFDEPGYKTFGPYFNYDNDQIQEMLLAYVNGIQALYHHPSLGSKIDIVLVRMDIMRTQPQDLPHFGGHRDYLLKSVCTWMSARNPQREDDPNHWDISLYLTGLDLYEDSNGQKNPITMGLATVGGACYDKYNCVIAEFGVTNRLGKPYPSAGFISVYIAAHEIGHNLGMHHDGSKNACPDEGYIMSKSRGFLGETEWSECSRNLVRKLPTTFPCLLDNPNRKLNKNLNHEKYQTLPGRRWNAKRQCEVLLKDPDAVAYNLHNACESLECKSPHRNGYYYAGPALEGTYCSLARECRHGVCTKLSPEEPDEPSEEEEEKEEEEEEEEQNDPSWSDWTFGPCKSGCIENSKGAYEQKRSCSSSNCKGLGYAVNLCRDDLSCEFRRSPVDFASAKCSSFAKHLPKLDSEGSGLQAPHENQRPWMACAIFCKAQENDSYYTPRIELNDLGLDPYFPDGTWCHRENGKDYFCRHHHCLPEEFAFVKNVVDSDQDLDFGFQNARPKENALSEQLIRYLSLGPDGRPLLTTLIPDIGTRSREDDWTDRDYNELPETFSLPKESTSASALNLM